MTSAIPTHALGALHQAGAQPPSVFFLGPGATGLPVHIYQPYRSNYYKVGLCLKGRAELKINLDSHVLEPGCVLLFTPHVIRQWLRIPPDFALLSLFFTADFLAAGGAPPPDAFGFFGHGATHVFQAAAPQAARLTSLLEVVGQHYGSAHAYRDAVLRHLIASLLYEVAAVYEQQVPTRPVRTHSQLLAAEFRRLLYAGSPAERNLPFYASQLCITPKHLAETVKQVTGRRAAEWLAEATVLEAKVLLHDPALTVGQVADCTLPQIERQL